MLFFLSHTRTFVNALSLSHAHSLSRTHTLSLTPLFFWNVLTEKLFRRKKVILESASFFLNNPFQFVFGVDVFVDNVVNVVSGTQQNVAQDCSLKTKWVLEAGKLLGDVGLRTANLFVGFV